ncbi:hypothetical protein C9397_04520 [Xanthomonas vasicola pv. vasculorum]|uniref:Uncharacterized protein n=2 Tax=Xanthomonas vasicola TaxID=56459 RepID=A0AAE8F6W3_XANVA|nr:hypothetical protein C7V42_15775 [Xanthomonas vasicola pv. vasculorum]AZR22198.1 hypothetical protein NX81_007470 [Xanthomonas vasicola]AZR26521.1 hypothetical protein NX80_008495 [Xanthomonas vasicola pv. arecae]AZR30239.1 hypothetical protein KWO_006510 [Xanthomonas vasicola pv. musacearum NCPPB 4379]RRJ36861.1 hypothetical protein EIM46_18630 [Xanthomonas vasicola pv. musacearum]
MSTSRPDWQDASRRMDSRAELALRQNAPAAIQLLSRRVLASRPIAFGPIGQSERNAGADFCRWRFRHGRSRRYQNVRCRCAARIPSRYRTAQIPGNITG